MALTYFDLDRNYLVNHYRFKPLKEGFLLTNDFGSWVYLDRNEFSLLRHNMIEKNTALSSLLKDKGFVVSRDNSDKIIENFKLRSRSLFRGTFHHVIRLEKYDLGEEQIKEKIKKITNFILQTTSREIIVDFKGEILLNFNAIEQFSEEFKNRNNKRIVFKVEIDSNNINMGILEYFIDNKFDVWIAIKNTAFDSYTLDIIKNLHRRLGINFYLSVTKQILGKEQTIIDFFVDNNFKSVFLRKTDDISKEEFVDFWKNVLDYAYFINKKNEKINFNEGLTSILLRKILDAHETFYPELSSLCSGAVVSEFGYTLDGNVYANGESIGIDIFNIGNVNLSYSSIISNEDSLSLISSSINSSPFLENNAFKPYIGNCPVCNYKENGNIVAKKSSERIYILNSMYEHLFERMIFGEDFLEFVQPK